MIRILSRTKSQVLSIKHRLLDDFVFIHINKTGGSSVEKVLRIPTEHKTALEKISEIGPATWERRLTFSIVRNPWDKVVSHYHFRVATNQNRLRDHPMDFREWVKMAYGEGDSAYCDDPKMFMPQMRWIADGNDNILVDEVIRFEHLSHDFNSLLDKLGKRPVILPHIKKTDRGGYRQYYDSETREIVGSRFHSDIARFGYRF